MVELPAVNREVESSNLSHSAKGTCLQEESYTSKASFIDDDRIPVYGEEPTKFSGKRISRGQYRTADGTVINADLNGSANILRKAFPNAVDTVNFDDVVVIKHPFMINGQKKPSNTISKSKSRRITKKCM